MEIVSGNICAEHLGLDEALYTSLAVRVTHIIHSAAMVKFSAPIEKARAINVEGTKQVLAFGRRAQECGSLQRFAYISTAYVSGRREGIIYEDELLPAALFANSYEQANHEAEAQVRTQMAFLPISIFRPSIIIGDSKTGKTMSFNVVYPPRSSSSVAWFPSFL